MNEDEPKSLKETSKLNDPFGGISPREYTVGPNTYTRPVKNTLQSTEGAPTVEQPTPPVQKRG